MWAAAGISVLDMDALRLRDLLLVERAAAAYEKEVRDGEA